MLLFQNFNWLIKILALFLILDPIQAYSTISRSWISSSFVKAGIFRVVSTGMTGTTSATATFPSSFTTIPYLAFGMQTYKGREIYKTLGQDNILKAQFQAFRSALTATTFQITLQIFGNKNIYTFDVSYFGVDPTFLYHLNPFEGTSVINVTTNATNFTSIFQDTFNYTAESTGRRFTTFSAPLSSNTIILFLTSINFANRGGAAKVYTPSLTTSCSVISSSQYTIRVTILIDTSVSQVKFSKIIFDKTQIQSAGVYYINYQSYTVSDTSVDSSKTVPSQLISNMIFGLSDYALTSETCALDYQWAFNSSGNFSISVYRTSPINSGCGISRSISHLLYMMGWQCPASHPYFNTTSSLCQDLCADYYYENMTTSLCSACSYGCIDCTSGSSTACTACEALTFRTKVGNSCPCNTQYFDNGYSSTCILCSDVITYCIQCTYSLNSSLSTSYYSGVFAAGTWKTDILLNFTCDLCQTPYFYNSTAKTCSLCTLNYCLTCASISACTTCDNTAGAIKYTDNLCYLCTISQCSSCSANEICANCLTGFKLTNNSCLYCNQSCDCDGYVLPMVGGICSTLCGDGYKVGAQGCDDGNTVSNDGCSSTCIVETCSQNCSCNGWVLPFVNGSCSTLCGDGYKVGAQGCDDGNTIDGDNCSSVCVLQSGGIVPMNEISNQAVEESKFLAQSSTYYVSSFLFLMGFRIIGIQMLSVVQHFQILLQKSGFSSLKISYNIHGFCDKDFYPFDIQFQNVNVSLFQYFNFMIFLLLIICVVGILVRIIGQAREKCTSKVSNKQNQSQKSAGGNSRRSRGQQLGMEQSQKLQNVNSQIQSQMSDQFAVHFTMQKKNDKHRQQGLDDINENRSFGDFSYQFQQQQEYKFNFFIKMGNILLFQVLFHLTINCLTIFTVSLIQEVINSVQTDTIFSFKKLFVAGFYVILTFVLIVMTSIKFSGTFYFGQNQFKFHTQLKALIFWSIVVFQKVVYSVLVYLDVDYMLHTTLGLKFCVIIIFISTSLFFQNIQKVRSIAIQVLHLLLIAGLFINKEVNLNTTLPKYFFELFFSINLGAVLLITLAFYVRELVFKCKADFRKTESSQQGLQSKKSNIFEVNDQQNQKSQKEKDVCAVFDQNSDMFSESADEIHKNVNVFSCQTSQFIPEQFKVQNKFKLKSKNNIIFSESSIKGTKINSKTNLNKKIKYKLVKTQNKIRDGLKVYEQSQQLGERIKRNQIQQKDDEKSQQAGHNNVQTLKLPQKMPGYIFESQDLQAQSVSTKNRKAIKKIKVSRHRRNVKNNQLHDPSLYQKQQYEGKQIIKKGYSTLQERNLQLMIDLGRNQPKNQGLPQTNLRLLQSSREFAKNQKELSQESLFEDVDKKTNLQGQIIDLSLSTKGTPVKVSNIKKIRLKTALIKKSFYDPSELSPTLQNQQ